jgi:hypothetical protein
MTKVFYTAFVSVLLIVHATALPAQILPSVSDSTKPTSPPRNIPAPFLPFIREAEKIGNGALTQWQNFQTMVLERAARRLEPSLQRYIQRKAGDGRASLDSAITAFRIEQYERLQALNALLLSLSPEERQLEITSQKFAEYARLEKFEQQLDTLLTRQIAKLSEHLEGLIAVSELKKADRAAGLTPARMPAETDELDTLLPTVSTPIGLDISLSFNSQSIWYGLQQNLLTRNDSDVVSGSTMLFSVTYTHPIGLWGGVELVGLFGQAQFLDQFTLHLGLERTFFETLNVGLTYSRYFFSSGSVQFSSIISDNLGAYLTYPTPILTPSLSINYSFSRTLNYLFLTLSASRTFIFESFFGGLFSLSPSISFDTGTLPSYTIRFSGTPLSTTRRTALRDQRRSAATRQEFLASSFSPLNLSLSLSLDYTLGNFRLSPSAHLAVPLNTPSYILELQPPPPLPLRQLGTFNEPKNGIFYFLITFALTL